MGRLPAGTRSDAISTRSGTASTPSVAGSTPSVAASTEGRRGAPSSVRQMGREILDGAGEVERESCTRQGQPKKYISAQRDMMDLKGGLFVFESK